MEISSIGDTILSLRKERNATQEELASFVGVSAQAVSKWENGGAPDCALLPAIADFLGVSIDALFGRSVTNYSGIKEAVAKQIIDAPEECRLELVDQFCWTMEKALFSGLSFSDNDVSGTPPREPGSRCCSEYHSESGGYTVVGLDSNLPFFLLLPKTPALSDFTVDVGELCDFFGALSDRAVLNALILLTRTPLKKFTAKRLAAELSIDVEKAEKVIGLLIKYNYVFGSEVEIDGAVHAVYTCCTGALSVLSPIMLFAAHLINGANNFIYFSGGSSIPCMR